MDDQDPNLPNAGWYQEPEGAPGKMRYWDGTRWTEHFHEQAPVPTPARSGSGSRVLEIGASVYLVLAWVVIGLGTIAVIAAATEAGDSTSRFDDTEPAVVVILGILYVAFLAFNLFIASSFIRKLLLVDETTRRTAAAVESLQHQRSS